MQLHIHRWGPKATERPPIVLVHGGILGGRETFRAQRPLAERWALLAPDRPGHGASPPGRQDFEPEAALVADQLLGAPAHLVGYSYGAIVATLAAALRPGSVLSLTVVEPPATDVARGRPAVDAWDAELRALFAADRGEGPRELLGAFFKIAGVPLDVPDPLPRQLERGVRALVGARPPGDARLPLDALARAPFRTLVVSGGHMAPYEIIADEIAARAGAERAVISGRAHLVPDVGEPFNLRLESFLEAAGR